MSEETHAVRMYVTPTIKARYFSDSFLPQATLFHLSDCLPEEASF